MPPPRDSYTLLKWVCHLLVVWPWDYLRSLNLSLFICELDFIIYFGVMAFKYFGSSLEVRNIVLYHSVKHYIYTFLYTLSFRAILPFPVYRNHTMCWTQWILNEHSRCSMK